MERNPKKSKALIITLVVILLFGILMYYLFTRSSFFGIKSNIDTQKFNPSLGTSKNKKLNPVGEGTDNTSTTGGANGGAGTTTDTTNTNTATNGATNSNQNATAPVQNPLPSPSNAGSPNIPGIAFINPCSTSSVTIFGITQTVNSSGASCGGTTVSGGGTGVGGGVGGSGSGGGAGKYTPAPLPPNFVPACSDTVDNDGDKLIDILDPGCHNDLEVYTEIPVEVPVPTTPVITLPGGKKSGPIIPTIPNCTDGIDNDKDGLLDTFDPDCHINSDIIMPFDPTLSENGTHPFLPPTVPMMPNPLLKLTKYPTKISKNPGMVMIVNYDTYMPLKTSELDFITACNDGIDNDGDGLIDPQDPGCHIDLNPNNQNSYDPNKESELNVIPACTDGIDNDKDKLIDSKDPGCHMDLNAKNIKSYDPNKMSELNVLPECADRKDNDGDKLVDGTDPECHKDGNAKNLKSFDPTLREAGYNFPKPTPGLPDCADGKDNDGDGLIDTKDPGCYDRNAIGGISSMGVYDKNRHEQDNQFNIAYECSDTFDNDGDKLIDIKDPECHSDGVVNIATTSFYCEEAPSVFGTGVTTAPQLIYLGDASDPTAKPKGAPTDNSCKKNKNGTSITFKKTETGPNKATYIKTNTEARIPVTSGLNVTQQPAVVQNQCVGFQLEFTDDEKKQLADLTSQFYRLSWKIKTQADVTNEIDQKKQFDNLVTLAVGTDSKKSGGLYGLCMAQSDPVNGGIDNKGYKGPLERLDNPYYQDPGTKNWFNNIKKEPMSYVPDEVSFLDGYDTNGVPTRSETDWPGIWQPNDGFQIVTKSTGSISLISGDWTITSSEVHQDYIHAKIHASQGFSVSVLYRDPNQYSNGNYINLVSDANGNIDLNYYPPGDGTSTVELVTNDKNKTLIAKYLVTFKQYVPGKHSKNHFINAVTSNGTNNGCTVGNGVDIDPTSKMVGGGAESCFNKPRYGLFDVKDIVDKADREKRPFYEDYNNGHWNEINDGGKLGARGDKADNGQYLPYSIARVLEIYSVDPINTGFYGSKFNFNSKEHKYFCNFTDQTDEGRWIDHINPNNPDTWACQLMYSLNTAAWRGSISKNNNFTYIDVHSLKRMIDAWVFQVSQGDRSYKAFGMQDIEDEANVW